MDRGSTKRGGSKTRNKRETHLVVVHEGWEKRQGLGENADYRLKNPKERKALLLNEVNWWGNRQSGVFLIYRRLLREFKY